jgi:hypothetical protein
VDVLEEAIEPKDRLANLSVKAYANNFQRFVNDAYRIYWEDYVQIHKKPPSGQKDGPRELNLWDDIIHKRTVEVIHKLMKGCVSFLKTWLRFEIVRIFFF